MDVDGRLVAIERTDAGDHGEHYGLGVRGVWDERDMCHRGSVDYAMHCFGIIAASRVLVSTSHLRRTSRY